MITANQTLHGYANGHQMLASSCEWSLDERKKMDVLSDLNGRCDEQECLPYYSGYPLDNGQQYVISKTWYAQEMPRPGCVWTHSVIIHMEDIAKIQNIEDIISFFHRPVINNYKLYTEMASFSDIEQGNTEYNEKLLEYLIYTIYGTDVPRLVYFDNHNDIIKELLYCIKVMPIQLLVTFSFCTMSYEARTYNNKLFSYQVTTKELATSMKRRIQELEICTPYKVVEKMPYWVKCFNNYIQRGKIEELYYFIINYGNHFCKWETFNGFVRIFFLLQNKKDLKLQDYFHFLSKVMEEYGEELIQKTIVLLMEDKFSVYEFDNAEYQILEMVDMGLFKLQKKHKKDLVDKILAGSLENLYPILCRYKEGMLKQNQKEVVENIVLGLKPIDLKCVSKMNEDICVILVCMNHKLLLSEDIWKADRAFQIMLLYAGGEWNDLQSLKELLHLIIEKDKYNVSNECYSTYGDSIIYLLLEIMQEERTGERETLKYWYPIIQKKPIDLLNALIHFQSRELCRALFLMIDKHDRLLFEGVRPDVWNIIFEKIVKTEEDREWLWRLYWDYIFIIFSLSHHFSNELVETIVRPIYEKMQNNSITMDEWNYFQYLLPQVEPCNSWDKCLRMREALNRKGYLLDGINC
jgi:hypothetical protein